MARMKAAFVNVFVATLFLAFLTHSCQSASSRNGITYVQDACSVTRYPNICIHSLASFSNVAKSPSMWARAGVSVTIHDTKSVVQYLKNLQSRWQVSGRNKVALLDCVECFENAVDELHRSLGLLRRLTKSTSDSQLSDLITWISAALTDEETCIDGFEGQKGNQIKLLRNWVLNVTYVTSNALALVNTLASTGLEEIPNL